MNKFNLIGCIGILAVCYGVGGRIHIQSPRHVEKTLFANAVAGTYEAKQTAVAYASTEASIQTTSLGTALSASEAWQRNEELQETRHHVRMDPYYPRFHLAPPVGWMNDPHPIYFKGAYHLFYQYSYILDRPYGGSHAWGHAMSSDLVRWRHYPPAVTPKDHGISEDAHIFSGCVVDNDGTGTALYTIKNNDIWLAISPDDDLAAFERCPANPVIKGPPPGLDISNMRDPWAWKEADGWYLIVGSGLRDGRGPVLPLYHSTSLRDWTYLHPLYQGDTTKDGSFCECPSFFPIGDKHVLVLSHQATYLVGRYENRRFTPEQRDRLDHGWIYVPQFVLDAKGRRIMWGWVPGWRQDLPRPREDVIRAGWSGLLTVPRVVTLGPDDRLRFEPVKELEMLRDKHVCLDDVTLLPNTTLTLDRPRGAHLEIDATLRASEANQYGVILLDSQQRIEVEYNLVSGSLRLGRQSGPLKLEQGEPLRLRIFVDGLVVEVFANRRLCLTEMIYPAQPKILQVGLFAHGGCATADRVEVWQMNSHWVK